MKITPENVFELFDLTGWSPIADVPTDRTMVLLFIPQPMRQSKNGRTVYMGCCGLTLTKSRLFTIENEFGFDVGKPLAFKHLDEPQLYLTPAEAEKAWG